VEIYVPSPIPVKGVVLKSVNTETNLYLPLFFHFLWIIWIYYFIPVSQCYNINCRGTVYRTLFTPVSQNCEKRPIASSCLSVRPHGTSRLPLDGFLRNLIFEDFSKICKENSSVIKIWQVSLYKDQYTFLIVSRSFILRMRNFSDKSCK